MLVFIVVSSGVLLTLAYFTYGSLLARLLRLRDDQPTPAVELKDDVDYIPTQPSLLMGQHFSAIAAAGPIVGPILAGVMFGWLPALLWILIGSIFIGGVHDMTSLVASVRHKARSIAEIVRDHMSARAYILFLLFVWLSLLYIVVAFTDITATSFVYPIPLENGQVVSGGGIATSSMLYLILPIIMGIVLRFTKVSLGLATIIFLPLVGVAIWVGQKIPLDLVTWLNITTADAQRVWCVLLVIYCFVASMTPMWLLLQPRGHLGGYFLYIALAGGLLGLLFGGRQIEYPAFRGWESANGEPLVPLLFITIACGACSGFHSLIASGTTSKQLRKESDARVIGYGAMLLEAMVAIVSLSFVMTLATTSELAQNPKPNFIYALGLGGFLEVLGIPPQLGTSFALMAFTTFVYDTLDVCTRLGRYILQELLGARSALSRWFATGVTVLAPLIFLLRQQPGGKPAWQIFWNVFGASNQLLASLTLIGLTVWLWRTRRAWWVWFVLGIPTVWMYIMSMWALSRIIQANLVDKSNPVLWVSCTLLFLGAFLLLEAAWALMRPTQTPPPRFSPVPA